MSTILQALDDEIARAYIGRACAVFSVGHKQNSPNSSLSHIKYLNQVFTATKLAQLCGMDLMSFCASHSMLPVIRAVAKNDMPSLEQTARRNVYVVPRSHAMACRRCIENDKTNTDHFIAYWRRKHHLPGVDWCPTHCEPLVCAPIEAIYSLPSRLELQPVETESGVIEFEMQQPVLQRLLAIQLHWLETFQSVHPAVVCEVLKDRCLALGLRSSQTGRRKVISDLVRLTFPETWLRRHFPDLLTKPEGIFFQRIDGTGCDRHVAYPSFAYAITLATTFDSANEALDAIRRRNDDRLVLQEQAQAGRLPQQSESITIGGKFKQIILASTQSSDLSSARPAVQNALGTFLEGTPLAEACRLHDVRHRELEKVVRELLRTDLIGGKSTTQHIMSPEVASV